MCLACLEITFAPLLFEVVRQDPHTWQRWSESYPTYNEDDTLKGYVITLQNFDKLITEGVKNGSILVTENTIETKNTFDI